MDGKQTPDNTTVNEGQLEPGMTVTPGSVASADSANDTANSSLPQSEASTPPPANQPASGYVAPTVDSDPPPPTSYYMPGDQPPAVSNDAFSWAASEYIAHHKSSGWYATLLGGALLVSGALWFVTKDVVSSFVVILAASVLAAYASRQPRELQYTVDSNGITVGDKHYPYAAFRSFSVIEEGAFSSVELLPLKRLGAPISMYYDPKDEESVTGAIAQRLPFEHRERDAIDKLMHKIRF